KIRCVHSSHTSALIRTPRVHASPRPTPCWLAPLGLRFITCKPCPKNPSSWRTSLASPTARLTSERSSSMPSSCKQYRQKRTAKPLFRSIGLAGKNHPALSSPYLLSPKRPGAGPHVARPRQLGNSAHSIHERAHPELIVEVTAE